MLLVLYAIGRHLEGRTVLVLAALLGRVRADRARRPTTYDDTPADYLLTVGLLVAGAGHHRPRAPPPHAAEPGAAREGASGSSASASRARSAAAEEERTRIAGELHDVVAHALSAMVVQASGARRLAERDPARAGEAFLAVETSGREALTEIRGLLGVLRREDEELALAPQPSLRHVATLVRKAQAAGLPVELTSRARRATCRSAST